MQIEIRTPGLNLGESNRSLVERRFQFALSRFQSRIAKVAVYLTDLNGPRGGIDKRCRVLVRLRPSGEVVLEVTDADLIVLLDRAADRISHAVARDLEHRREAHRRPEAPQPMQELAG